MSYDPNALNRFDSGGDGIDGRDAIELHNPARSEDDPTSAYEPDTNEAELDAVGPDLETIFTPAELEDLRKETVGVLGDPDPWIRQLVAEYAEIDLTDPVKKQELIDYITEEAGFLYT